MSFVDGDGLMALEVVPERVFSEATRDVDVVATSAHGGLLDPLDTEATRRRRALLVIQVGELLRP